MHIASGLDWSDRKLKTFAVKKLRQILIFRIKCGILLSKGVILLLQKFCVENFKCFSKKLEFDLGKSGNYEFNTHAVRNSIVNKGIIYGFNGSGKSNLGLAIFDIISHLTDKQNASDAYIPYLNLNNPIPKPASFEYYFIFNDIPVNYFYKKNNQEALVFESLEINGQEVLRYDHIEHSGFVSLPGSETLNLNAPESSISRVKFVRSNAILRRSVEVSAFMDFVSFIDNMLLFYSLETNRYQGFKTGKDSVGGAIIKAGKTSEFEAFLNENNVNIRLSEKEVDGELSLMARYGNAEVSFYRVASRGTKSLALFFYWYIVMEQASLVFIDEFDAFYHFELAENIVKKLTKFENVQILLTTHNTDLLTNDLLRPDCYYWIDDGKISALADLTEKEIRRAHNLQKMFKAGAFNE